jgi:hypothetical protein
MSDVMKAVFIGIVKKVLVEMRAIYTVHEYSEGTSFGTECFK